jgi:anthranilate synthase component 1
MYYPSLAEIKNRSNQGNSIPVCREVVADLETPVSAFLKIKRAGPAFLLESIEGGQHLARYSFIGADPYKILKVGQDESIDPLPLLEKEIQRFQVAQVEGLPRFLGGAVGYLGSETAARFEKLPVPEKDELELPLALFMFVDTLLVFDHVTHKIKVFSQVRLDGDIEAEYNAAVAKIDEMIARLNQPLPAAAVKPGRAEKAAFTSNVTKEQFIDSVNKIKQNINAGEVIQVVLSQRLSRPTALPPFNIYRALRTINPSPYMYFLDFVDFQIIGTSPEILVRVEDGRVMTRPLAGTRPRGRTTEEDIKLEQELKADEKERAEHIMLVDLGRNDIGRVTSPVRSKSAS